jgi:hypothetical protein
MKIKIVDRWDSQRVLYECEAETLRDAVLNAIAAGARLVNADLAGADLTDADLTDADLSGADLARADLAGADLARADLAGADLTDANLSGANLAHADLAAIRADLFAVLDKVPNELPGLLAALREGRINGSVYSGECACLIGTIANVRGCTHDALPGLVPNSNRAAERWFLAIGVGHTPKNHPVAKITETWIEEWAAAR